MTIPRITPYEMPRRAELPDGRAPFRLDVKRAALLIHDLQDYFLDFFERGSSPASALVQNVARLRALARRSGVPVIYTKQPGEQRSEERGLLSVLWGPGITALPARASIIEALAPEPEDRVLVKWRYSAFQRTTLLPILRELRRDQLIITGIYAHIGCLLTAAEAFMNDIQPFFVADAVADFSSEQHLGAARYVADCCGRVVLTGDLEAMLAEPELAASSYDALADEIATLLSVDVKELQPDEPLFNWGLDSLRIMTLVERWRARGLDVSFVTLAEEPTLSAFARLFSGASRP